MSFYISQGIGFIGMALIFISFQQNDKRRILWIQAGAGLVFALHFILLGAPTGMSMNLVEIPRNLILSRKHEKKYQIMWAVIFIAAFAAVGVLTQESIFSLFPISAMSCSTIVFSLKNPRMIRFLSLPVSVLWLTYNILSSSIAGIMTESFCLVSLFTAIFRFDVFTKKNDTAL
jgi:hypothetical protein